MDYPRLIEHAFPLEQASLDSVHEKNVRHGHISTLHIWPARRPLAACRAALIATLLPDPSAEAKPEGMSDDQWQEEIKRRRAELCEKIGGRVVRKVEKKKMPNGQIIERVKKETEGGILHWGRETENADTMEWFRQKIREAYGGRAPKVLDPFAGGGAIPLEAMRLGCEATAVDINPVAWFILKCTLEYPQRLAGQTRRLPNLAVADGDFMADYLKAKGLTTAQIAKTLAKLGQGENGQGWLDLEYEGEDDVLQADLAWHVRAWGRWVLARARRELARFYPTYADYEPLRRGERSYEHQPMRLVPLAEDGTPDIDSLNAEFSADYLGDKRNPRWVAKTTVAYLWARTVKCKNCRATVPLLKTRWLCKEKDGSKRILLTMEPAADKSGVVFGIQSDVPGRGGNAAQRREHDKRIGAGTMSRAGAKCPCCGAIMTMEDIRVEAQARQVKHLLSTVVLDGPEGKEYRLPTAVEQQVSEVDDDSLTTFFTRIPLGLPNEPTPAGGGRGAGRAFSVQGYGLMRWRDLFTGRQLADLGAFIDGIRSATRAMQDSEYGPEWVEALTGYLAACISKLLDYENTLTSWYTQNEQITHLFNRFALPMKWDFAEASPIGGASGSWESMLGSVAKTVDTAVRLPNGLVKPQVIKGSAIHVEGGPYDVVLTDPPYYDAIPYSDLMDFFYVWLRRTLYGLTPHMDAAFTEALAPKWNEAEQDGELIDDDSRHHNDTTKSKATYEQGMYRAFQASFNALKPDGRMVIVFAHKAPDAWETLVSGMIRAGFVVDGSWPIQTEMANRARSHNSAALASSVWLVCRKRPAAAKPGWDNNVLAEMRKNIAKQLREFWDAGIRGPDFVWAATGPAMEAYSKHPVVKKANDPGSVMTVSEFLTHVRRMVVDFVVGRVLSGDGDAADQAAGDKLDEPTAYYLLHRHDFGMEEAPAGTCILYAVSCGLSDRELADTWDILARVGGTEPAAEADEPEEADADDATEEDEGSGSKLKLKTWAQRRGKSMGYEAPSGKPVPLIDRVHRLMHLWKAGDVHKVDEYLDDNALRRNELFKRLLQSLIELSPHGSDERSMLESLSNHIGAKGAKTKETGELFEKNEE